MDYTPRFAYVVLSIVLAVALLWISGYVTNERATLGLILGAVVFFAASLVFLWTFIVEANRNYLSTMDDFAGTYAKLDEESRAALGFKFPALRYHMKRGKVGEYFEDTSATAEQFRLFLKTSNDKYISPERDWCTQEMPRFAWAEIKEWLEGEGYIQPDSAAGSHSWLWVGNAYRHLMAYWMSGRHLQDMNAVYASDEEMVYER